MISFKNFLDKLHEETSQGIDEDWFKEGSFETAKKPVPVKYRIATEPGTIVSKESKKDDPVRYEAGHAIMTGTKNEEWPVDPETFTASYNADPETGMATPKRVVKMAKVADHNGVVAASWGNLHYRKDKDIIVRHGPNNYGVVDREIFGDTYEPEPQAS